MGFGWVEVETLAPEILITSFDVFSFVDVVGTGVAPASMTQSNIDTSSLTNPAVTFVWQARNGNAEVNDVLQIDWRLSGGVWEQLGEFDLTNTLTIVEELPLPPAAMNNSIDIRFVIIVDEFQEGIFLDDVGVCEALGPPDCNSNGVDDATDIAGGTSNDNNVNNIPDECDECVFDSDCSNGLFCDGVEICIIDVCQFQSPPCMAGQLCDEGNDVCFADGPDCNGNEFGDATDIAGATSDDLNANGIPDECDECVFDFECDDGLFCTGVESCNVDACESAGDPCNAGQVCNDETDVCDPDGPDCNSNGVGDAEDIGGGTSDDSNTNAVPDECDACVFDADCDDGQFCTGIETCSTDVCSSSGDPCLAGQICNEVVDGCDPDGDDCNSNSIGDATDIAGATSDDLNSNGMPDECDECVFDGDCDDGLFCNGGESCDVDACVAGMSPCTVGETCDEEADECIVTVDCNSNSVSDALDIAGATSDDINVNSVPDECDECVTDGDCDNGLFCDGVEICNVDLCTNGAGPCQIGQTCDEGVDACLPIGADCNSNAIGDATDIAAATSNDANTNSIPDECDECTVDAGCDDGEFCNGLEICNIDICTNGMSPCAMGQTCDENLDQCLPDGADCNSNGIGDSTDIASATSEDLNTNGIPDECDECVFDADCDDGLFCSGIETCSIDTCLAGMDPCLTGQTCDDGNDTCPPPGTDCNSNGIGDTTDIAGGTSLDCNTNGSPDSCDISVGTSIDCNTNAIPDACDLVFGGFADCNTNGVLDVCDLAGNSSADCDANGIPDECEVDEDGDGTIDACDLCPDTPLGLVMGSNGCPIELGPCCFFGTTCIDDRIESECAILDGTYMGDGFTCDLDPDGDGVTGCDDLCPLDGEKSDPGVCGCGISDTDSDLDGFADCIDQCPASPLGDPVNDCGCSALGACAFNQGFCWDDLDESTCTQISGFYLGDGTLCDDVFMFGDFDEDGDVDLVDFSYFQECFNTTAEGEMGWPCMPGDFDGCGQIDLADYDAFARFLDGPVPAP
ncbi:MAG: hypothetical protein DHS20C16_09750 [Phycisphaerae bacterium]|nr:MAG: hypothetical protein DHS20C16_09750 [Phycisphaerae bacterium]